MPSTAKLHTPGTEMYFCKVLLKVGKQPWAGGETMEAFLVLHRAAGSSETERGTGRLGQVGASRRGSVSWRPGSHLCTEPQRSSSAPGSRQQLPMQPYLLMDVARAPFLALLPAQQLSCLQEPIPGTARLRPGRPRVQLLKVGAVPKIFRS